jgi:hypothetical protein
MMHKNCRRFGARSGSPNATQAGGNAAPASQDGLSPAARLE